MPAPPVVWRRTLRTLSSERFLALLADREAVAVDLHYLPNGHASGTVVVLEDSGIRQEHLPELLSSLDDGFLPDVDLASGSLTYTVVFGRLAGVFEATDAPPITGPSR